MERWDDRPFQLAITTDRHSWKMFELESRIYLQTKIREFISIIHYSTLATDEIRQQLTACRDQFGVQFTVQLVRTLPQSDVDERTAIVWLLTQLNDHTAIPLLERLSYQSYYPRAIRLSAALALAGMGATREMRTTRRPRLYALS